MGVVSQVVAERAFLAHVAGGDRAFDHEFGVGGYSVSCGCAGYYVQRSAHQHRRQQPLVDPFGQGSDRRDCKRRRAAQKYAYVEFPAQLSRPGEVESAAFFDLPVHARRRAVETLQAVYAQVPYACFAVYGVDQREREELSAVQRPALQNRQAVKLRRVETFVHDRPARNISHACLQDLSNVLSLRP